MDAILNSTLVNYLVVALGLGFVIFIHELGHFLVAKWCKVKVELFALGFGPVLVAYRKGIGVRFGSTSGAYEKHRAERAQAAEGEGGDSGPGAVVGETEYSIRAIPLGGFVKMLGEGEEPDSEAARTTDPRAYSNKSVGARMAIISAGVIMNVILGLACFAIAYGRGGLPVIPARISGVMAGSPAFDAGLKAGDEIVAVDGRDDIDFLVLRRVTAMSGPDQVLHLSVSRPGQKDLLEIDVKPTRQGDEMMKTMGILMPLDVTLAAPPYLTPAGLSGPVEQTQALRPGDRVVAAGPEGAEPEPVGDIHELWELMTRYRDTPLSIVVEPDSAGQEAATGQLQRTVTLPVVPFVDFGFRLTMGQVVGIQPGSPAAEAGFRVGDRIVGVEGLDELDPMRLPDFLYERAGEPVAIRVARTEGGKPEEELTLTVTPEAVPIWTEPTGGQEPLEVPPLGLAYAVEPKITSVRPDSPAARAGLTPGAVLQSITLTPPALGSGTTPEPVTRYLDSRAGEPAFSWPGVFAELQGLPRHAVSLTETTASGPIRLSPEPDPTWFNPQRGLLFQTLHRPMPPMAVVPAIRHGLRETTQTIQDVYAMFRSLVLGMISPKALGGPIMIADMASQTARLGLVAFLQFLGMLSLNLAVINFLPIPPLDGGQMAFLIAEMFRGRPLPERALSAGTIVGLMLVLTLMVFVFYQDVMRYILG